MSVGDKAKITKTNATRAVRQFHAWEVRNMLVAKIAEEARLDVGHIGQGTTVQVEYHHDDARRMDYVTVTVTIDHNYVRPGSDAPVES